MKKILTFSLVMMLMMVGVVSAVDFTNPTGGEDISGDLEVEWTNTESFTGLTLQYKKGVICTSNIGWADLTVIIGSTPITYDWDTTGEEDGNYCLRLQSGQTTYNNSGVFTIDNADPIADFEVSGTQVIGEEIEFDAGESFDDGSGIDTYAWDFDNDGEIDDMDEVVYNTFSEPGDYTVVLTVTDLAGNEDTKTKSIEIEGIETEDTFLFDAGILGIKNLEVSEDNFDTEINNVVCEFVVLEVPNGLDIGDGGSECTLDWTNIPYEDRGTYNLIVKAIGNEETKYFDVEINVYTWMIELEEGWNLISIPMMPESTNIKDVLGEIKENLASDYSVWSYQYNEGTENKWYKSKATWTGDLDDIVPGYAYWIKMENEDVLKGIGNVEPGMGQTASVIVTNGWNLIGHYGLSEFTIENALTSLTLDTTEYYDVVVTDDGNFHPYEGYWMTAKFLPNGITSYTPAQEVIDNILFVL